MTTKAATKSVAKKAAAKARVVKKTAAKGAKKTSARGATSGVVTKATGAAPGASASELISGRIADLGDWRGATLAQVRALILEADPDIVEEWKWRGTPVWSHDGGVCTGEVYREAVKLTFFHGAALADPKKLFNSSLEGNTRRAIDLHEGVKLNAKAFAALFREAVEWNRLKKVGKGGER